MSTKTLVQQQQKQQGSSQAVIVTTAAGTAATALQQLSSISLMLEYDIDNTLNTIKESGSHMIKDISKFPTKQKQTTTSGIPVLLEINNNEKNGECLPTPPATPNLQTTARKRWKILAKVLRKDSEETVSSSGEDEEKSASVRRFKSFDLLRQDSFEDHITLNCLGKPENWYKYKVQLDGSQQIEYSVNIHHIDRHLTASDLMGFNNTGNICVWPSEEALTAYALSDLARFHGKWILELGGGMTCLSGLMLSKYAKPYAVHLTDGNQLSVENVKKTICLNELSCYTKCSVLQWQDVTGRSPTEHEKFDFILSADCLFFDEARKALVETIWFYLARTGVGFIMAPKRGKTMSAFVDECSRKGFLIDVIHRYNDIIWQRHLELKDCELYDEDLHYPVLIQLKKPSAENC